MSINYKAVNLIGWDFSELSLDNLHLDFHSYLVDDYIENELMVDVGVSYLFSWNVDSCTIMWEWFKQNIREIIEDYLGKNVEMIGNCFTGNFEYFGVRYSPDVIVKPVLVFEPENHIGVYVY